MPKPNLAIHLALLIVVGTCAWPLPALADGDGERWQFQVMPYLWLPALDASADLTMSRLDTATGSDIGPVSLSAETDPDNYFINLDMAFMFMGEARNGPWSV